MLPTKNNISLLTYLPLRTGSHSPLHEPLSFQPITSSLPPFSPLSLHQNNPPTIVRERVLGLIQYWADAFKGKPQLVAVEEMYEQLKVDGVEFPPIDLDSLAPIETPTSRVRGGVWSRGSPSLWGGGGVQSDKLE